MQKQKNYSLFAACIVLLCYAAVCSAAGPCQLTLDGDLDRDCKVTMGDFARFASEWLTDWTTEPGAFLPAGIFVATPAYGGNDQPACGSILEPCASIEYGIDRAVDSAYSYVFVADGSYSETVTIVDGVALWGAFDPDTWVRGDLEQSNTVIMGGMVGSHAKTLVADSVTNSTEVSGFVIRGADATTAGGNSYAVWIKDCDADFVLEYNRVYAGHGADGTQGTDGADGSNGTDGAPGLSAKDTSYDCFEQCDGLGETSGGSAGAMNCGGADISGGDGGTAVCPDWNETVNNCTGCSGTENQTLATASMGQDGSGPLRGLGGDGGYDGYIDEYCNGSCSMLVPAGAMDAQDGQPGSDGMDGMGGAGPSDAFGTVSAGEWAGAAGDSGGDGTSGGGGGGGGAGGGVEHDGPDSCGFGRSDVGGSGGGGGSGGCRGTAGAGGAAGGGSFGIFVVNSAPSSSGPTLLYNVIYGGRGGDGGDGGFGGQHGLGGQGAEGGAGGQGGSTYWGAGAGGAGASGGNGGHGGGGGGGAGGVSYGLFTWNITGPPDYHSWNTFEGTAAGGAGGKGGKSIGDDGADATAGDAADYVYHE